MKLWLIGGEERHAAAIAEAFEDVNVVHWSEKANDHRVRFKQAPPAITHVMVVTGAVFNEQVHAGREEARRLGIPFLSCQGKAEAVQKLMEVGARRKLRKPSPGELETIVRREASLDTCLFGNRREKNEQRDRIASVVRAAGLSSDARSVEACLYRLGEQEKAERRAKAEAERRARESVPAPATPAMVHRAPEVPAVRLEPVEVVVRPAAEQAANGAVKDVEAALVMLGECAATIRDRLTKLLPQLGQVEDLKREVGDLRAKLDMIREGLGA